MSTLVEPLNKLRKAKDRKFQEEENKSFDELKKILMSDRVLTFYEPDLRQNYDALSYGLGAVLSHVDAAGRARDIPIEFISRTLSPTERRYSQIEKRSAQNCVLPVRVR